MKRGFSSTMGAVFLFALAGCGAGGGGVYANSYCRVTAVCPGGYYCEASNGVCYASGYHTGCLHDLDCGAGAYCAGMAMINYNSYPQAPEVMLEPDGSLRLLRRRQSLDQIVTNEV